MKNSYSVILSPLRTEKGSVMSPLGKYLFWVDTTANKLEVKKAVEEIYKVKVKSVNTLTMRGKKKRVRFIEGKTSDWKKAIVTLKEGDKIDTA
ncbi:MAG: 50S ribosomal protein L23 [Candidatus Omnitrophica bacterium]|nr:50S ribosomal protein L23 [Candidatus Omnitrophota bacterium]